MGRNITRVERSIPTFLAILGNHVEKCLLQFNIFPCVRFQQWICEINSVSHLLLVYHGPASPPPSPQLELHTVIRYRQ